MFTAHVNDLPHIFLPLALRSYFEQALALLATAPEPGKYPLEDEMAFLIVAEEYTAPLAERRPEIHSRYLDVQLLLEGEELMGYRPQRATELPDDDRLLTQDLAFFNRLAGEQFLQMRPGDFVIFWPGDAHRPLCAVSEPLLIRKAILKVDVALLGV
ncbi:MAG: YhcH/YjgK/YiaL family protein [Aeromonadaceae bacterium]